MTIAYDKVSKLFYSFSVHFYGHYIFWWKINDSSRFKVYRASKMYWFANLTLFQPYWIWYMSYVGKKKIYGFQMFSIMSFVLGTIVENFWRFEISKILFVCSFLEGLLILTTPSKNSGTESFDLGFLIKINNFMKKMNDWSPNMQMVCNKIPLKIVKKDLL